MFPFQASRAFKHGPATFPDKQRVNTAGIEALGRHDLGDRRMSVNVHPPKTGWPW